LELVGLYLLVILWTIMNIVIFGETGSGKSSIVNGLVGRKVAAVSDKAVGCTFTYDVYKMGAYNLYDTVGLSEGDHGTKSLEVALKELCNLLKSLSEGVSLLIYVSKKGRITKSIDANYKIFVDKLCMGNVPVVLVITHFDKHPGNWWMDNKEHFDKYGMNFATVICGCSMDPADATDVQKELIASTSENIREAITKYVLPAPWKVEGGALVWFKTVVTGILGILSFFFPTTVLPAFIQSLYNLFN